MRALSNVTPTSEQLAILTDDGAGYRLIRGAAGSGKTTTALLRLRQLCASRISRQVRLGSSEPVRVLALTFNRTLRGYINQLVDERVRPNGNLDLTIDTFARWAMGIVGQREILRDDGEELIRSHINATGVAQSNTDYFVDEVRYILGRFPAGRRRAYLRAQRSGRGRSPAIPRDLRMKLLNEVIKPYEASKSRSGKLDWNDLAIEIAETTSEGYDIVVVDETQDMSANQVRAIIAHLNQDHTTTFIIDAVQRIYPQAFQWREVGINMRPQLVRSLEINYRNTAEIASLASSLIRGLPQEEDGVLPDARASLRNGARPQVVVGLYSNQVAYMIDRVQSYLDADQTVAILQPRGAGGLTTPSTHFDSAALRIVNSLVRETGRMVRNSWRCPPSTQRRGLEFDHVLMPGLNQEVTPHGAGDDDGTLDSLRRLVAMGVGRARNTVMLGYKPEDRSTLFDFIDPETYDKMEV